MPFIPREKLEHRAIGQWVRLTCDIDIMAGRFTSGTAMQIIDKGPRGFNLRDEEGNELLEVTSNLFKPTSDPTYVWHEKN